MNWRVVVRAVGLVAAVLLVVTLFSTQSTPVAAGTKAPPVYARLLDGREAMLKLDQGRFTIVNVWATWCPPCLQEIPDLIAAHAHFQEKYGDKVRMVGIAADSPPSAVKDMATRYGITYDIALARTDMLQSWNATMLPSTYIVNGSGVIVWSTSGAVEGAALEATLAEVMR